MFLFLSYIPIVLGSWLIGALVYLNNPRNRANKTFSFFCINLGLWLCMLYLSEAQFSSELNLWGLRLALFFSTYMILFLFYFACYFPTRGRKLSKSFNLFNISLALVLSSASLTPLIIPNMDIVSDSYKPVNAYYSFAYLVKCGHTIVLAFVSFLIILNKYHKSNQRQRAQIKLLCLGIVVALLVNAVTSILLPVFGKGNNFFDLIGNSSTLLLLCLAGQAIVRYKMFEIKLAILRTLFFLLIIFSFGTIYSLLVFSIGVKITGNNIFLNGEKYGIFVVTALSVIILFTFRYIEKIVINISRKIFYDDIYNIKEVINDLSSGLTSINKIDQIMDLSLAVIKKSIKPEYATFIVYKRSKVFKVQVLGKDSCVSYQRTYQLIKQNASNPVIIDSLGKTSEYFDLVGNDVEVLIGIGSSKSPIGAIVYGPKKSGKAYNSQDIALMQVIAKSLFLAIENSVRHEKIRGFSKYLKTKVDTATSELLAANKELRDVDKMKDNFISMASHQLRSPASTINEALQLLGSNEAKLTHVERERLNTLAAKSSLHLTNVISNMLDISRIQAGQLKMVLSKFDVDKIIGQSIERMEIFANAKNIKIKYDALNGSLTCYADREKLSESFSNYIDNAIKYSSSDSVVRVNTHLEDGYIVFEVLDTGIGVPKNEREKLFERFFRASNAKETQPEGSGIGLFFVKCIAEAHGGEVFYRPLRKGSIFGIKLPI